LPTTRALPLHGVSPATLFGQVDDATWRWLHLEGRDECPFLADYLPSLPPDAVQQQITASLGQTALARGFATYELYKQLVCEHGHALTPSDVVLDFGCGWGRIIRYFIRDVQPENLWGIDVNEMAIETCRQTNRWSNFERVNALPPSPFGDGTFNLVYAFSVFSHLSEESHLAWLDEFERILQPGGVFISTTGDRGLIEACADWARRDPKLLAAWQKQAAKSFSPSDEWLAAYDRGEYCFSPGDTPLGEHFGTTCIPEEYVRRRWSQHFEVRAYFGRPYQQVVIVCRR
jgi:SAM-dependent methyltransferase